MPLSSKYQNATDFLAGLDQDWAQLIIAVGPCSFEPKLKSEPYEALIRALAYQQLHAKTADTIINRLVNVYDNKFPRPHQLLATEFDTLRGCRFSGIKIEILKDIASSTVSGIVPSRMDAEAMTDKDLIERLVTLKGIGRWTVEMLLMFTLERMDILPANDLGIVEGYKRLKKLGAAPRPKEMTEIAKRYSPYKTIASLYLWRAPKLK